MAEKSDVNDAGVSDTVDEPDDVELPPAAGDFDPELPHAATVRTAPTAMATTAERFRVMRIVFPPVLM